ncbi:MAG: metallophosphoesterase [Mailhella sp.]|nr:metallophosphoesterase [Mailhella sp.]
MNAAQGAPVRLIYASLAIACYVFVSLVAPLRIRRIFKLLLGLLLLAAALKFQLYRFFGGSFFDPGLPAAFRLVCEALHCALVVLFFLALAKDIARLVLRRFGRGLPFSCGLRHAVFMLAALGTGAWSVFQAMRVPDVRRVEAAMPGLPAELDGFAIVQLSDLHIGPLLDRGWLEKVAEKTNALKPDLIVLTGDLADGFTSQRMDAVQPLRTLRARLGVYGVPGNHEYYYDARAWADAFAAMGVRMLENEHVTLPGGPVLGGVTDPAAQRFGLPGPDVRKAFEGAPPDMPKILLSHRPSGKGIPCAEAALQLSGHTHGGHLFFLRPVIARFNGGFAGGMYRTAQGGLLYVSRGTGLWNGFSCRLAVPSEITLIILRRQPGAA